MTTDFLSDMSVITLTAGRGRRFARFLPRGRALPEAVWWRRHRGILALLWLHVPGIAAMAAARGVSFQHGVLEVVPVASLAVAATTMRRRRRVATVVASLGLLTSSAVIVHLSGGLIEMHFHYFVMVGVVTLYQDWRPFLAAIGYVVFQHGLAGAVSPESVYNHGPAVEAPWTWAGVHGAFILAMSAAGVISWRLNESLLESTADRERRLGEAQGLARLGSWEYDLATGGLVWSDETYRLYGVDRSVEPNRALVTSLLHPDDVAAFDADVERSRTKGVPLDLDYRIVLSDGSIRWLHRRGEITEWEAGQPIRMAGTVQDITERKRAEETVREREADLRSALSLLQATLESTADGILVVDADGHIASYNHQFADMWQIPQAVLTSRDDHAVLAHATRGLVDPEAFVRRIADLNSRPEAESHDTIEFVDGRVFERYSKPQRVGGDIVGRVWSFRDVTLRKRLERELARQAFHDPLTGLANQALFRDRAEHALLRAGRTGGSVAVVLIDLDHFKNINDSLGHLAGDELLVEATAAMQSVLHREDTAARLGGDEFAILLEDAGGSAGATALAERVLETLRRPFEVAGREVFIGASAGVAVGGPELTVDQILRNADLAMYRAKSAGRGCVEVFAPEMHDLAVERLELEADLRRAVERDELRIQYQAVFDIGDRSVLGVEALLRWHHPVRGVIGPDAFIPVAEESGLIDELGRWVLETACRQVRAWQLASRGRTEPLRLSVNVSPRQLRDDRLVNHVAAVLAETGMPAGTLTLEITEGAMMHETAEALDRLDSLKALGVELSVDDFGTGYSSLRYLQRFPIDELKIDRSFVQRVHEGPEDSSLAKAIVRLAQTLRLRVVAEGVETDEQLDALRALGCDAAQGYLLHRPSDPSEVVALLARDFEAALAVAS